MRLVVLFGSQTGTAQDVAEHIWRESKKFGFSGPVMSMDEYPIQKLIEEHLVIFVAATTGNGDEPDNMRNAWRFLRRKSLATDSLQQLQFACLGLGDSSYERFNFTAKRLFKRLLQLGAVNILPLGLCDDQHDHGLNAVALPWMQGLWTTLRHKNDIQEVPLSSTSNLFKWNVNVLTARTNELESENLLRWPFPGSYQEYELKSNERITSLDHFQDVRLLKFRIPDGITWNPGDVLNIRPHNSVTQIEIFLSLIAEHKLPFQADTIVQLSSAHPDMALPIAYAQPVTVLQLAKYIWDLNAVPRQRAFELLAVNCDDALEKEKLLELISAAGIDDFIQYTHRPRRNILEVLQDFPHACAKLQLHLLFEMFPIIQPRSFSIASSAPAKSGADDNTTLDLLVAVVEYKTKLSTPRLGLCSNWLKNLEPGICTVPAVIRPGTLLLPQEMSTPLIMIGPGTGIAPFRSIIQERSRAQREAGQKIGELILYFGCRYKAKDFHFRNDLQKWQETNLAQTFIAFSRDQTNKLYVQHLIKQTKSLLNTLIREKQAIVLVAGSSKNMPRAVKEAITYVLDNDVQYVEEMIKAKRYQEETWS